MINGGPAILAGLLPWPGYCGRIQHEHIKERTCMEFEHLVQVNDLKEPNIKPLTRPQLWQGLVWRAREPDRFVVGLDDFVLLENTENHLKRRLHLPGLIVEDEVWLAPQEQVRYEIVPTENIAGGDLTMTIEEPEPGALFVRFRYCTKYFQDLGEELPYDLFVQQAYVAADIDTIRLIRDRFGS